MTFENKNMRCHDCKFWWPISESDREPTRSSAIFGECRYDAPSASIQELPEHKTRYAFWVATKRDDWCGRHERLQLL